MNKIVKRRNSARGYTLISFAFVLIILILAMPSLRAQKETLNSDKKTIPPRHEVKDDDYNPSPRDQHPTSSAYKYDVPGFTVVQVNVNDSSMNILNDAANEPSITFDPNNPEKMAIGWRQFDDVSNNFRQAGNGYTTDGGVTWTFPEVIDPGVFRSDPVLDCDAEGNFYYNALTYEGEDYWCDVFKSTDGGATWDEGVYAQGGDKQWMTIDKSGGMGSGNIYAFWNVNYSICDPGFFTRSVDDGMSYEECTFFDGSPYWGTCVVSGEGELYTCGATWWGDFIVNKSSTAQNDTLPMAWDSWSIVSLNGDVVGWQGYESPNPTGILGQVYINVDSSGGPTHGNVYLLASVEPYSGSDPMDVMIARSTDGGETWSNPVRVNDDPTSDAWQWLGTMSVAPDGRIDVVWLDTRDNPGTVLSVLYYAYSIDAGDTWSENYALSESFDPHVGWPSQDKMGDYFEMFSDETGAHLAWAATFNGEQDVYYSYITTPTGSPVTISQPEFLDIFTPGSPLFIIEGENNLVDIGNTDGANIYDFSFVEWEDMLMINNYEASQIPALAVRYPMEAFTIGETPQSIHSSPVFLSGIDSIYIIGEATVADVPHFIHYQPYELFSSFPINYPADFWQEIDVYDTTFTSGWLLDSTNYYLDSLVVEIDGYGTLQLADQNFECLRMKREYTWGQYKEFLYLTNDGVLVVVTDVPINEPDTGFVNAEYQVLLSASFGNTAYEENTTIAFELEQNFPNPFINNTTIRYNIQHKGFVSLKLFDITGREVAVLINEEQTSGSHHVEFDTSNLKSGLYYYRMEHENNSITKKLMIMD